MSHYCVSNPCWICHPEFAPKQQSYFQPLKNHISLPLRELLVAVFKQGLDEDEHFRSMGSDLDLEKIKIERAAIDPNSLEAQLLDLMIADFGKGSI